LRNEKNEHYLDILIELANENRINKYQTTILVLLKSKRCLLSVKKLKINSACTAVVGIQ